MSVCPSWISNAKTYRITKTRNDTNEVMIYCIETLRYWCIWFVCKWICSWHSYDPSQSIFLCGYCSMFLCSRCWMRWNWLETLKKLCWCLIFTLTAMCQDMCPPAEKCQQGVDCVVLIYVFDQISDVRLRGRRPQHACCHGAGEGPWWGRDHV